MVNQFDLSNNSVIFEKFFFDMPNKTLLRTIYIAAIALLITLFDASAQSRVPGYVRDSIAKSFQRIVREEVKGCYPKIEDIRSESPHLRY